MSDQSKSLDILGVKPIAESINKVTSATVDGAASFLGRICLPAAEEFGLLLRDRVRGWRAANIAAITARAEAQLENANAPDNVHAHPRLVSGILDEGSWTEDPIVQDLWGGLLSSSCTESGDDDSNLLFVNFLSELTRMQARLLKYVCENARKIAAPNGLIQSEHMTITLEKLIDITSESDIHRLDREMDHLREVGLIYGGFDPYTSTDANVAPSTIALHMYVRCHGSRESPVDFFGIEIKEPEAAGSESTDEVAS